MTESQPIEGVALDEAAKKIKGEIQESLMENRDFSKALQKRFWDFPNIDGISISFITGNSSFLISHCHIFSALSKQISISRHEPQGKKVLEMATITTVGEHAEKIEYMQLDDRGEILIRESNNQAAVDGARGLIDSLKPAETPDSQ